MPDTTIAARSTKSLFPTGELAWSGMDNGTMRKLSDGISVQAERDRLAAEKILSDFFPNSTELIAEWEEVFALPTGELLTQEQRAKRLAGAWRGITPGSYSGMNEIFSLSGIAAKARPLAADEDPRILATTDIQRTIYLASCGNMECGVEGANSECGSFIVIPATAEVRTFADGRQGNIEKNFTFTCNDGHECGASDSICGNYLGYNILDPLLTIPNDTRYWPLIFVIEGYNGGFAQIPKELQRAFDFLTYKMKPNFMWAIVRVEFV